VIDAQGQQGLIRQHEPAFAEPPVWRQIGRQRELDVRSAHPLLDGFAHKLRQPSLRRIHTRVIIPLMRVKQVLSNAQQTTPTC
jgi:hypothetical protein